jgi:hypothetical protein
VSAAQVAPLVVVVAGANGAGKSTAVPNLLRDTLNVTEFVNADAIAAGLSAFRPESVAIAAGRIMLARMRQLADARENFAFETTLASRSLAPWLAGLQRTGYRVHLLFLWLRSAELAVRRVENVCASGDMMFPRGLCGGVIAQDCSILSNCICRWWTAGSFSTIPRQARGRLRPENGGSCGISAMRRPGAG